jgi:quinol---cytochrome c reductase iron-sulfur subunit, bacillus type
MTQFLSALIASMFALPVFTFIRGSSSSKTNDFYPVARIGDLQEDITRVSFTRFIQDGWMTRSVEDYVWVRKKADGTLMIFEPHCTHLGCAYAWNQSNRDFECPCHGGKFDENGNRIAGPPPRPLDRYQVKIVNGEIQIGKITESNKLRAMTNEKKA